jgi:hypothetical protein
VREGLLLIDGLLLTERIQRNRGDFFRACSHLSSFRRGNLGGLIAVIGAERYIDVVSGSGPLMTLESGLCQ